MFLERSAVNGVSARDLHFLRTVGSRSRGVNLENVVVPLRAQSPSPAAIDGGGLATFDGEKPAGVSPGRVLPAMGHGQF